MRVAVLSASVLFLGSALAAAACSSSDSPGVTPEDDAGSSGSSGTSGTSGTSGSSGSSGGEDGGNDAGDAGPALPTTLKSGEVSLLGTTADERVVYTVAAGAERSIEAVPVAGGTPDVIGKVAADEYVSIAGNAVAFWTAVDANAGVGTFNVWTKAAGTKTPAGGTDSVVGLVAAASDTSRIAFSFNSPADTADFAVTTPGAPSTTANATTGVLADVNVISPQCAPDVNFVGKTFFAAHCTGNGNALTNARLVTIPDAANPAPQVLVDNNNAASSIRSLWISDKAGTKLFVLGVQNSQARVVTVAGAAVARIENNVASAFLSDDGASIFYRTAGAAFRRAPTTNNATPANPPAGAVTLVPDMYVGTLNIAPDKKNVLFRKLAPVGGQNEVPRLDINLVDVTGNAAATPVALVATATGFPAGFTASGGYALYLADSNAGGIGKLKVRAVGAGGAEREVAPVAGLPRPAGATGNKAVYFDNVKVVGQAATVDVRAFDAASTAAPALVAAAVDPFFVIAGSKVVFTKSGAGGGLFAADVP